MRLQIAELVITPENEDTIQRIVNVTQKHEQPEQLYLVGPANSGKSTLMEARGTEKDLLSTKKAVYCHASEILAMLTIENENADNFLNRIGEVEVLFIDDVEDFLSNESMGAQACGLLIESRAKQGLDTVVSAHTPLSELDDSLRKVFSGFQELRLPALNEKGACELAKAYVKYLVRTKGESKVVNELSPEAFEYLGKKFCHSLKDMAPAMEFLLTVAEVPTGQSISAETAHMLLSL